MFSGLGTSGDLDLGAIALDNRRRRRRRSRGGKRRRTVRKTARRAAKAAAAPHSVAEKALLRKMKSLSRKRDRRSRALYLKAKRDFRAMRAVAPPVRAEFRSASAKQIHAVAAPSDLGLKPSAPAACPPCPPQRPPRHRRQRKHDDPVALSEMNYLANSIYGQYGEAMGEAFEEAPTLLEQYPLILPAAIGAIVGVILCRG